MNIHLKALNEVNSMIFEGSVSIDAQALVEMAEGRAALARAKGREFTEGAVPFFAGELLRTAQQGASEDELRKQSINVAMAAWLADSIYGNVSPSDFVGSNLHFTLMPGGAVRYDRIRKDA